MSTRKAPKPTTPAERTEALAQAHVTASNVLNTITTELGIETDGELARIAGVSKATVSTWRRRNSIPFEFIAYLSLIGAIDMTYVITGRGRLSNFLMPSESIDDPELQREIIAMSLSKAAPISLDEADIDRAATDIEYWRRFCCDFIQREHKEMNRPFVGIRSLIPTAIELLRDLKKSVISRRRTSDEKGPQ